MASVMNRTFEYVAGQDFDFKNLRARKGERLPDAWQYTEMAKRLKEKYGDTSVERRLLNPVPESPERKSLPQESPSSGRPDEAGPEIRKGRRGRKPR